jgi:dTDP-L-rhamnose 4-epimerase
MRVLLTGGAGFIGTHVRGVLQARGHEVTVLDSLRSDVHRGAPPAIDGLIVGDVRDPAVVDGALRQVNVVCHRHITADSSSARENLGWAAEIDFAAGMTELAG